MSENKVKMGCRVFNSKVTDSRSGDSEKYMTEFMNTEGIEVFDIRQSSAAAQYNDSQYRGAESSRSERAKGNYVLVTWTLWFYDRRVEKEESK